MLENPKGVLQGGSAAKYLAKTGTEFRIGTEPVLLLWTNGNSVMAGSRLVN